MKDKHKRLPNILPVIVSDNITTSCTIAVNYFLSKNAPQTLFDTFAGEGEKVVDLILQPQMFAEPLHSAVG